MEYIHHYASPFGGITLASDGESLTGLWFDGQKYFGSTLSDEYEQRELPVFEQADRWLEIYFSGRKPAAVDYEDDTVSQGSVGAAAYDSLWADYDLWRACETGC